MGGARAGRWGLAALTKWDSDSGPAVPPPGMPPPALLAPPIRDGTESGSTLGGTRRDRIRSPRRRRRGFQADIPRDTRRCGNGSRRSRALPGLGPDRQKGFAAHRNRSCAKGLRPGAATSLPGQGRP